MGVDLAGCGSGGFSGRETPLVAKTGRGRNDCHSRSLVIPAKAGSRGPPSSKPSSAWIPAFAGMTEERFHRAALGRKTFPFPSLSFPLEGFFSLFCRFRKALAFLAFRLSR
jgi:hypothetical protein